jgi:GR25 family glycosyltransferase involved in LPS biosynthesis
VLYRPEREARVRAVLAHCCTPDPHLFLGPDARETAVPPGCTLTPAEVACWQGHREIVEHAATQDDLCLVLEDDALPEPFWRHRLHALLRAADRPWDYLNLGRYYTIGTVPVWPGVEDAFSLTTHAYLLSPDGARKYAAQFADPTHLALDWLPMRLRMLGLLTVYTATPRLFTQDRTLPGMIHDNAEPAEFWPATLAKPDARWLAHP